MPLRPVLLALLWMMLPAAIASAQVTQNIASESDLPSGKGLAAQYPGDVGIEKHEGVIFADNFESGNWDKWENINNKEGKVLKLVDASEDGAPVGKHSLRVTARLDHNEGGGMTRWFKPVDRVFVRFYVKFDEDCDYIHHFVGLRANKGLYGRDRWSGFGGAGNKPVGDERFSTRLEPWGANGKLTPPGKWNFYSYWHEMKRGGDGRYWGNHFSVEQEETVPRGQWICCEMMLKHNTPGKADGEQAFWIDGKLLGHFQGINWRTSPTLFANSMTLESFVTDRWTKQNENIVTFDNVVVADRYIGPAGKE